MVSSQTPVTWSMVAGWAGPVGLSVSVGSVGSVGWVGSLGSLASVGSLGPLGSLGSVGPAGLDGSLAVVAGRSDSGVASPPVVVAGTSVVEAGAEAETTTDEPVPATTAVPACVVAQAVVWA